MTMLGALDLASKLLLFGWFSYAAFTHFATAGKEPVGSLAVKGLSVIGLGLNLWLLFSKDESPSSALGLAVTLVSASVFFLAIRASRAAGLHVSFSAPTGSTLVSSGIYRFVRNPLYLSYILYWASWVISVEFHLLSIMTLVVLLVLYMASIRLEEQELEHSFGEAYVNYRKRTSRLVPYIF